MVEPAMMREAAFASGMPSAFDTNGTVARARVRLDDVEHPADTANCTFSRPARRRLRRSRGRAAHAVDLGAAERDGRQRARRVAGVDAGLFEVLHDAADVQLGPVVERVDVELDGVVEEAVDEQGLPSSMTTSPAVRTK
jgi:hypothetical protein